MSIKRAVSVSLCLLLCLLTAYASATPMLQLLAGNGSVGADNGTALVATFRMPYGIALDNGGTLLVADSYNNLLRQVASAQVTTIAGKSAGSDGFGFPQGGLVDGSAATALLNRPRGLAVDASGNVYIADSQNHAIRKLSQGAVRTLAGNGSAGFRDGLGSLARFNTPSGLALGSDGSLYIADTLNHVIRRLSSQGVVSTFAGVAAVDGAYLDGACNLARFNEPAALAFAPDGSLLVADAGNQLIRQIKSGQVTTYAGQFAAYPTDSAYAVGTLVDGPCATARFNFPKGLAVAGNGVVFVADTWNHAVRAITKEGQVITLARQADGADGSIALDGPVGLAYADGQLYIADQWANTVWQLAVDAEHLLAVTEPVVTPRPLVFDQDTSQIQVWLDGNRTAFSDQQPLLQSGITWVPLRALCEQWGASVTWDAEQQTVLVSKGEFRAVFRMTDTNALQNRAGRTLVGLRRLAESLKLRVEWVAQYRAVVIETP